MMTDEWKTTEEALAEVNGSAVVTDEDRYELTVRDAAVEFLDRCSLTPTPDAVDQLVEAFLPALEIMCKRGYDPDGKTWRKAGWRGQLMEIRKKTERLWHRSWLHGAFDHDSAIDLLNYAGFYIRLRASGPSWGEWGEPGSLGAAVSDVSMGHYEEVTRKQP